LPSGVGAELQIIAPDPDPTFFFIKDSKRYKIKFKRNCQCCESGMFIPDPDFYPSRILDPKTATKERDEKKFVLTFYVATNFSKLQII
jgi:hypothetical protein